MFTPPKVETPSNAKRPIDETAEFQRNVHRPTQVPLLDTASPEGESAEPQDGYVNSGSSDDREILNIFLENLRNNTHCYLPNKSPYELADRILTNMFTDPKECCEIIDHIFQESILQENYSDILFLLDMGISPPSSVIQMNIFRWFFNEMRNVKGDLMRVLRFSVTTTMDKKQSFLNWSVIQIVSLLFKRRFSHDDLYYYLRALIDATNSCGTDFLTIIIERFNLLGRDFNFYTYVYVLLTHFPNQLGESYANELLHEALINGNLDLEIFQKIMQLTGANKCMSSWIHMKKLSQDTEFSKKIELLIDHTEEFCISPYLLRFVNPALLMKYFIGPRPFHFETIEWVVLESRVFSDEEMTQIVNHYMDDLTEKMVEEFLQRLLFYNQITRVVNFLKMGLPVPYQHYSLDMKAEINNVLWAVFGDAQNRMVNAWRKAFLREEMLPMTTQSEKTAALVFYAYHQMTEEFRKTLETVEDTDTLLNMVPPGFLSKPITVLLMLARIPSPTGIPMTEYFWKRLRELM